MSSVEARSVTRVAKITFPLALCLSRILQHRQACELSLQLRYEFEQVADEAVIGDFEDRSVRILVDGNHDAGVLHAGEVLNGAGNTNRDVEFGRDDLARLADLAVIGRVARIDRGTRGAYCRTQRIGQRPDQRLELLGRAEGSSPGNDDAR